MNENISKVTDDLLIWFKLGDGLFLDGKEFYEEAIEYALYNEAALGKDMDVIIEDIHRVIQNIK